MLCGGVHKCCAVLCGSVCTLLSGVCKLCGWSRHVCMDGTTCRSSFAGNLPVSDAYEQLRKGVCVNSSRNGLPSMWKRDLSSKSSPLKSSVNCLPLMKSVKLL